jgi:hypothetical protein
MDGEGERRLREFQERREADRLVREREEAERLAAQLRQPARPAEPRARIFARNRPAPRPRVDDEE